MKRKVSLILAIIMVFAASIPGFIHAEQGMGLEEAIKFAKGLLEISEEYTEFNYGVSTYSGKRVWDFRWTRKDMYESSINVMMDDSGDILRYYNYNYNYTGTGMGKKLPNVSRSKAQEIAEDFIKKLNSQDLFDSLKLVESSQRSVGETSYYFYYIAIHDGVPVPFNNINVSVNYDTGEIQSYSKTWAYDVEFPKADDAIGLEEAEKVYREELGLKLTYNLAGDKVYLAYTPVYSSQYVIDAISGEVINPAPISRDIYYEGMPAGGMGERGVDVAAEKVILTPEEIKSIEESGELITQEEAEKIAREFEIFEIDDSFILDGASLRRGWDFERNYIWDLYLLKEDREAKDYKYINVSLNANTGEILNFDISYPMVEGEKKFTEEEAKKVVEEFLEKIHPEKFKNTKYEKSDRDIIIMENETGRYNFKYVRVVNGIPFVDNYINVRFDGINGKIYGFYMNWQEVEIPLAEGVLPIDEAYNLFFENVGLKLEYRQMGLPYVNSEKARAVAEAAGVAVDAVASAEIDAATDAAVDAVASAEIDAAADTAVDSAAGEAVTSVMPMPVPRAAKKSVNLVYAVNTDKPSILDAFTGELLNADGEPYVEKAPVEYTDISDHYAKEQIETLAEIGIALEGPTFRPNEKIKQKDFLLLISQIIDRGYDFYNKTALENNSETERLYNLLIREGIVKEDEKNPEAPLTREESVKFVIRTLKYDKVADLKDIFNCDFLDKDEIDADLIGYVVLAKGFNIVNGYGNYFRPKEELKRGDAIIIIYNSLKVLP